MRINMIFRVAALLLLPMALFAQGITTASINGRVLSTEGEPMIGANVVVTHEPTGTVTGAATRTDGSYKVPGLKPGGPYTVTVSYIGYETEKRENIYLSLGQDRTLNFTIAESAVQLGEIVTVAEKNNIISSTRTGAATNVTVTEIEALPTINRGFQDFTRLSPQFADAGRNEGAYSASGRNNRYNNVQIDGAVNNDLFGLADSGTPGGQAGTQPISLDAIQEFQLLVAPYDVRQGGFTGGGINAITRSGTNIFHGSAYFFGRNQSLVGDGPQNEPFANFKEQQIGFRFGGPLVRDKVFFFVNGEIARRDEPLDFVIDGSGSSTDFAKGNQALVQDAQRFRDILINEYGHDPGGFGQFTRKTPNNKIFARLDFNLSEKHKLILRHNYINADNDVLFRDSGVFRFPDQNYKFKNKTNSTVAQLNSTLGNDVYNEARVNLTFIRDDRAPEVPFPQVQVTVGTGLEFRAGTEQFSTANALDQNIVEVTDDLTFFKGAHTLTVGTHNEIFSFKNLFIRDNFGTYVFNSLDDFANGVASRYDHSFSNDPNDPRKAASFDVFQLGLYVGDQWAVRQNFNLTLGFRVDVPLMPDTPTANPDVEAAFGIKTNQTAGGNPLFSPRLGFNWDVKKDATTQVRGGIGIFSGRTPYVWVSNQYSNTGIEFTRIRRTGTDTPQFSADPFNQFESTAGAFTNEVDLIDKDFKFPQVLRTNLGFDRQLPLGLIGTVDFLYSKTINDILYQNLNRTPSGNTLPDGRDLLQVVDNQFTDVIFLTNTSRGYQWDATFQLKRPLAEGLLAGVGYTYGRAKDLNSGKSSQAVSNWGKNEVTINPNDPELTTSDFETRHRILANVTYEKSFIHNAPTTFSLFYVGRSGRPYSTTYSSDINGDGQSYDLVYVPKDRNDVILTSNNWDALDAFIDGDPALKDARGSIVSRNASREPWYHRVDLRIAQDLPVPTVSGNQIQITFDILNVLNLLNSDWGKLEFINDSDFRDNRAFAFQGVDPATGKIMMSFTERPQRFEISQLDSRWQAQFGIRYIF